MKSTDEKIDALFKLFQKASAVKLVIQQTKQRTDQAELQLRRQAEVLVALSKATNVKFLSELGHLIGQTHQDSLGEMPGTLNPNISYTNFILHHFCS